MSQIDTCTHVRNVSGVATRFSFLPEMAGRKTMAVNEQVAIPGDLLAFLSMPSNKRRLHAFQTALTSNKLEVIQSPSRMIYDATLTVVKTLGIDNGAVTINNPGYGAYTGGSAPS